MREASRSEWSTPFARHALSYQTKQTARKAPVPPLILHTEAQYGACFAVLLGIVGSTTASDAPNLPTEAFIRIGPKQRNHVGLDQRFLRFLGLRSHAVAPGRRQWFHARSKARNPADGSPRPGRTG